MKISDYKNEEAVELLADLLEPTAKILGDKKIQKAVQNNISKFKLIQMAMKSHSKDMIKILRVIDKDEDTDYSAITVLNRFLDIFNDKELLDFFTSQAQMMAQTSSTSAMANTEAEGK